MERRRRGLGLKRPPSANEKLNCNQETPQKANRNQNILSRKTDKKLSAEGDREGPSEVACVANQQRTPQRPVQTEILSPVSSGPELVFPSILGSPEVEVSWDWGCSQVPRDMLLPKQVRKSNQPRQPSPLISPVVRCPRVIQSSQMSEEENQARLAFYKNVLSQASKCKKEEHLQSDFMDQNDKIHSNSVTPKRPVVKLSGLTGGKIQMSEMLDDSVDELMVECSQAIEEQLKNGQIVLGPNVNVKIPNHKHALSPDLELENPQKRVCHGKSKLNLFPESPKTEEVKTSVEKRRLSLRSPKSQLSNNNSNHLSNGKSLLVPNGKISSNVESDIVSLEPNNQTIMKNSSTLMKTDKNLNHFKNEDKVVFTDSDFEKLRLNVQSKPETLNRPSVNLNCGNSEKRFSIPKPPTLNNNCISRCSSLQSNGVQGNVNSMNYDSVDKFRRTPKSVSNSSNVQVVNKANGMCNPVVIDNVPKPTKSTMNQVSAPNQFRCNTSNNGIKAVEKRLSNSDQGTQQQRNDLTSLLDDEFDEELSTLDVDSLCNSQEAVAPKVCTQDEIEAKRKAALSRLMMKRRR